MIRSFKAYIFFIIIGIRLYFYFKWVKPRLSRKREEHATAKLWTNIGEKSRQRFLKLGGIYIKLGQFFANAAHIFPEEFITPLQELQDRVPPLAFEKIIKRFYIDWNCHPDEIFESFDRTPIASASTAQVHRAVYKSKSVAVKILYPGIEAQVKDDLRIIGYILKLIDRFIFPIHYKQIHEQLANLFLPELDMNSERKNIQKMEWFFRNEENLIVPKIVGTFNTTGILVTEFIDGVKFNQLPRIQSKTSQKSESINLLVKAYLLMVFRYRFFHADPHPGNLIVTHDRKLCFLDFGSVGIIHEKEEKSLIQIFEAALNQNPTGILNSLDAMGVLQEDVDRSEVLRLIEYSLERISGIMQSMEKFQNLSSSGIDWESDIAFLKSMRTGLKDLVRALKPPDNYVALQRTIDLIIGNTALIDPYHSIFEYAEEPFRRLILKERFFDWVFSFFKS